MLEQGNPAVFTQVPLPYLPSVLRIRIRLDPELFPGSGSEIVGNTIYLKIIEFMDLAPRLAHGWVTIQVLKWML